MWHSSHYSQLSGVNYLSTFCLCVSDQEEVLKSRVLLLQLMQNCFPMLPNPLEQSVPDEGAKAAAGPSTSSRAEILLQSVTAVGELYAHLCHSKNHLTSAQQGVFDDSLLTRK